MKTLKTAFIGLAVVASLCACDRTPDVAGSWTGNAMQIGYSGKKDVTGPLVNGQITNTLTFTPSVNKDNTGTIEVASVIDLIDAVPFEGNITDPYELSVSATAIASGTYRFTDDDEIAVAIDPSTINISVDPDAVAYSENVLSGAQVPAIDSIRTQVATAYKAKLVPIVKLEYAKLQRIDDIKIHDNIMSCEIADRDCTLRRN